MINKKLFLFLASGVTIIAFLTLVLKEVLCNNDFGCTEWVAHAIGPLTIYLIPVLFFATVCLLLRDEVFKIWFPFCVVYSVLYFIVLFGSPSTGNSYIAPSQREVVGLLGLYGFSIISAVLILIKVFVVYRNKKR